MGLELAKAFITVRGDSSGLRSDLNGMKQVVDSAMKDIAAGAAAILTPFARFGKGIFAQGFAAAGATEQTLVAFETMLGSAEEALSTMEELTKYAVETPFEKPEIIQASRGLIQFGERGDELMSTLKMLGDVSSGTSTQFGLIALIFNQVRGVGKLLTQDFRQLSTRGVLSLQDIADYYQVTTAEAQAMMTAGRITFEDTRAILKGLTEEGGRFFDMTRRQSTTLVGLQSTLNDAWRDFSRVIAGTLAPELKKWRELKIELISRLYEFVEAGGQTIGYAFAGATAFAILGASIFGATFAAQLLGLTFMRVFVGTGVGALVIALGTSLGWLVAKIRQNERAMAYLMDIFENLKPLAVEALGAMQRAWNAVATAVGLAGDSTTGFVESTLEMLAFLTTDLSATWELLQLSAAIKLVQIQQFFVETFQFMAPYAAATFNSIGLILGALGQIFAEIFGGIRDTITTNVSAAVQSIVSTVTGITGAIWGTVTGAFSAVGDFLLWVLTKPFHVLWELGKLAFVAVMEMGVFAGKLLLSALVLPFQLMWTIGSAIINNIGTIITLPFQVLWGVATTLIPALFVMFMETVIWAGQTAGTLLVLPFQLMWQIASAVFTGLVALVQLPFQMMFSSSVTVFETIMQLVQLPFKLLWSMGTTVFSALISIATKPFQVMSQAIQWVLGIGYNLFTNFGTFLVEVFSAAIDAITGFFSSLWESIKSGFTGEGFMGPISDAFNKQLGSIQSKFSGVGAGIATEFHSAINAEMPDNLFGETIADLEGQMENIAGGIEGKFDALDGIDGPGKGTGDNLQQEAAAESIAEKISGALDSGRYGFAQIGTSLQDMLLDKGKDELGEKRNKLLEEGNAKQDQLLDKMDSVTGAVASFA